MHSEQLRILNGLAVMLYGNGILIIMDEFEYLVNKIAYTFKYHSMCMSLINIYVYLSMQIMAFSNSMIYFNIFVKELVYVNCFNLEFNSNILNCTFAC